jgi:hypothetical protein
LPDEVFKERQKRVQWRYSLKGCVQHSVGIRSLQPVNYVLGQGCLAGTRPTDDAGYQRSAAGRIGRLAEPVEQLVDHCGLDEALIIGWKP